MYNSELVIEEGSSLVIEDNVTFLAKRGTNKIIINGNDQLGQGVNFLYENDAQLIIELNNSNINLTIDQGTFAHTAVVSYSDYLAINNSQFTNGGIYGFCGNYIINNTSFYNSWAKFYNADSSIRFVQIINGCYFSGFSLDYPIVLENYPNFIIDDNIVTNCFSGIRLFNSGYGKDDQRISENTITNNNETGVSIYHSYAEIKQNQILNNRYGIKCLNKSDVYLEGNSQAYIPEQTQQISDNISYEVYATKGSFPFFFRWNAVSDPDNIDPLVYYTGTEDGLDVRYNNWGINFNAEEDFYPWEAYNYIPVWPLLGGSGAPPSGAETLYNAAKDKIVQEDYTGAKYDFQQIVTQYPETKYAQSALRELFTLEKYAGNNYSELKTYYDTEPNIQNIADLNKLADFLANFCEIKLENYPTAITWFENIIQNPDTIEDSIFAIIDLGYTYFLMENGGLKSSFMGSMPEHIPIDRKQFEEKRDYLLSLLFIDNQMNEFQKNLNTLKSGKLLQNIPNPFSEKTQIW
jgi:hypothetical protein